MDWKPFVSLTLLILIAFGIIKFALVMESRSTYEAIEATLIERHYVPRSFNCCESFITIWNCGEHGILRADNEEIYRFGRNKEILVLRNGHKIEGFYK
jgi:hypothetical protein